MIVTRHSESTQRMLAESQSSVSRWAYLLEGIKNPRQRSLCARLLDNQVQSGLFEDDTTSDIPTFTTLALAFIPKVYPSLLVDRIASVQPMNGPTARVFFEDFVSDFNSSYSFTHGEVAALADATTAPTTTATGSGSTFDAGVWYAAYTFVTGMGETRMSALSAGLTLTAGQKIRVAAISIPTGATGVNYYVSVGPGSQLLRLAASNANGAQIDIAAAPVSGAAAPPTSNTTSPQVSEAASIPKSRYKLTAATVTAQKWALEVQWTTELQEDLRAQYNQDLQARVFDYVAREILGNIDSSVLAAMMAGVPGGSQVSWSKAAVSGYTQRDWDQTLYGAIVDASLAVEKLRFRHPDYIVASPAFAARLEKLETFKAVGWPVGRDDERQQAGQIGVNVFGTVAGRWAVYRSPWIGDGSGGYGQALVGITGEGYIYAPYIPVQLGPILPIPGTDEFARTMRTRAGTYLSIANAFGSVTVTS